MLQIKCEHCNATLKGKDIIVTPFYNHIADIKYKDYRTTCPKCGGVILWDKAVQKAEENKAKALAKNGIKSEYDIVMRKVQKNAKELSPTLKGKQEVRMKAEYKAINRLPSKEKAIILAHEDKENVALLNTKPVNPIGNINPESILLLTQAIIESAVIDNDEDFFASQYGAQIVDMYNTALTIHTKHNYNITAELLLEKLHKGDLRALLIEVNNIVL